jgi:Permuted papain-like amidase enzyme, YaeF/YiiX, C92 family
MNLTAVRSFFTRCRARLIHRLVMFLAQPVGRYRAAQTTDLQSLATALRHGDVILASGCTRAAALVRRATGSCWAHVALYVGPLDEAADPRCIVEADIAEGVRTVPLSEFHGQRVLVLRPTGLSQEDRRRLAEWILTRVGDRYDLAHAWALTKTLLRLPVPVCVPPVSETATRFICSSLLAQAFLLVGYPIPATHARVRASSPPDLRYVTPRDFEGASGFEVIGPT